MIYIFFFSLCFIHFLYDNLMNNCLLMKLRWEGGAGHIKINGTQYQLNQAHWHSPSEHTINGKRFLLFIN